MHKLLIAVVAFGIFAAGPALATEQTDAMARVHQFIDGFNKGDIKQKGKAIKETNAMMARALQKGSAGWQIVGWSWATP